MTDLPDFAAMSDEEFVAWLTANRPQLAGVSAVKETNR